MKYQGKLSTFAKEVCEALRKMNSSKCKWTWYNTYQTLYDRAKNIIRKNVTIAFYSEKEQLYLETGMLGVGLSL